MDASSPRFRVLAALGTAIVGVVAIAALVAATPARSGGAVQLLPDVTIVRPHDAYLRRSQGRLFLRLDNTVANRGTGPLEIFPGDEQDECNPPGTVNIGREAFQRVFLDNPSADSDGYFDRADDTSSDVFSAGCMRYHPEHDHWHFDNYARYQLRRLPSKKVVGTTDKVGFCLFDGFDQFLGLPGAPPEGQGYYPHEPGNPNTSCTDTSINGLSIGWADIYTGDVTGQAINVTGIREGRFCLISTADPERRLLDSDYRNNSRGTRLEIRPPRHVKPLPGRCSAR